MEDLSKTFAEAEHGKRLACRLGDQRVLRDTRFAWWGFVLAIAVILAVLALSMDTVPHVVNLFTPR